MFNLIRFAFDLFDLRCLYWEKEWIIILRRTRVEFVKEMIAVLQKHIAVVVHREENSADISP